MSRRIMQLLNLMELIESGVISIASVQSKSKDCFDNKEADQITPEKFIESLEYLNESILFRNAIDFYYKFTSNYGIHIECGMKSPYMDEYFYVDCVIKEGVSMNDVSRKLGETIFDVTKRKIAV